MAHGQVLAPRIRGRLRSEVVSLSKGRSALGPVRVTTGISAALPAETHVPPEAVS